MSGMNPFLEDDERAAWEKGANAALAVVEEIGAQGGEYITNIITEAGDALFGAPEEGGAMKRPDRCPNCGESCTQHTGEYCQRCGEVLVKPKRSVLEIVAIPWYDKRWLS